MAVAGIATGFRFRPGEGTNILRVGGAVAVTVDVITDLPDRIVAGRITVIDIPVRVDRHIFSTVDMFWPVRHFPISINRRIVAVIAGIFSYPLRPDQSVMAVR